MSDKDNRLPPNARPAGGLPPGNNRPGGPLQPGAERRLSPPEGRNNPGAPVPGGGQPPRAEEGTSVFNRFDAQRGAAPQKPASRPGLKRSAPDEREGSYSLKSGEIVSGRTNVRPPKSPKKESTYNLKSGNIISGRQAIKRDYDQDEGDMPYYEDEPEEGSSGLAMGVLKIVLYLAAVLAISAILGYNIIMIGNDVFSFVKPPLDAQVTIPDGATLKDISGIFYADGLIKYKGVFELYVKLRHKDSDFLPGTYPMSSSMNYDQLVGAIRPGSESLDTIQLTIPEGYTAADIIKLFVANGIGTEYGFYDALNGTGYDYAFLTQLDGANLSPDRKYRLEGYLFPDTYEFYRTSSERTVVNKLLTNFNNKFPKEFYNRAQTLGLSIDQVVTIASIIEREAKFAEDYPIVSSVLHNRLDNPSAFPYLECDSTIQYSFDQHKDQLTGDDLKLNLPYNTYLHPGLPPSAICNPGYEAIYNALYPDTTNYYYFVSDKEGHMLYASTAAQQTANIKKARG